MSEKENLKAQMFKQGPLHDQRFELIKQFKLIGLKNGDILYRASNALGPLGMPFSRLVAKLTNSRYSHAALVFFENDEIQVLEINDQGTLRYRMLDWLDTCFTSHMAIYRLKDLTDEQENKLYEQIKKFLEDDPEYDFTFSDPKKFYCTESVIEIYKKALGIQLVPGSYIYESVPKWKYVLMRIGSFISAFFGASLPFNERLFYPGTDKKGMIASEFTYKVFEI